MSSTINIHVREQEKNSLEQTTGTPAKGFVVAQAMSGVSSVLDKLDSFTDCLYTEGGLVPNSIIFCTDKGIIIEIIDAKIDVTKKNTLTEVALINRAGKVKERIQADDYTVTVKGSLIAGQGRFPYPELVLLNQILGDTRSINVANVYLFSFGITKLALKNAEFKQSEAKGFNAMPFTLTFVSDKNYNFLEEDLAQTGEA